VRVAVSWSSGKDSAWCLHILRGKREIEVAGLLTTLNESAGRVSMHAVRRDLLRKQAAAVNLPLWMIDLPWPCSNADYESRMVAACGELIAQGVEAVAFGDLFLEDVRAYRERQMAGTGLQPLFPVWGRHTAELAREMIGAGLRARLTCIDPRVLPRTFAGREFDTSLLNDLPHGVDPCGENGEFHTFVYDAPGFAFPVSVLTGEIVDREGFTFVDLIEPIKAPRAP
jgi:uncharacterized protein (TIGR00290 family)